MKKEILIMAVLVLGLSFKSFAGTGSVNDGFMFILVIAGILFILFTLFAGIDFLHRNRRRIINNTSSFLNKKISLLINLINRLKSFNIKLSQI